MHVSPVTADMYGHESVSVVSAGTSEVEINISQVCGGVGG